MLIVSRFIDLDILFKKKIKEKKGRGKPFSMLS